MNRSSLDVSTQNDEMIGSVESGIDGLGGDFLMVRAFLL